MRVPFGLRRLVLLSRGLWTDRDRPDLVRLAGISEPDRFCWEILPHAARSFAVSIALLPEREAKGAAVAYLYARMLDSYEDLYPDPEGGREALQGFANRFHSDPLEPAPQLPTDLARDDRDRAHMLLVRRCDMVDAVYLSLSEAHRFEIADLLARMAAGMTWASETFEVQSGVLKDAAQLRRYCHIVIGEPTRFVLGLIARRPLNQAETRDALEVSELIQLANVTRDIERDLARGVAYHPALAAYLGTMPSTREAIEAVNLARNSMTLAALSRVKAYRRLAMAIHLPAISQERAAAVAMLRFTERHYMRQARLLSAVGGRRASPKAIVVAGALAGGFSRRWADRQLERTERRMLSMAGELDGLIKSSVTPGSDA